MHTCVWFAWYIATRTYVRTHVHAMYMLYERPEKRLICDDSEGRK
jgi:hypothetical protein